VRAKPGDAPQQVASQPGVASNQPDKRRDQRHSLKLNVTAGKEPLDLLLSYSSHIRVPGIIGMIVIPENETVALYDSDHLGGYLLLYARVEGRSERRRLNFPAEPPI